MQRSISDDLATPPPSDGPPFALPSLSPSSSSTVFSSSSSPLLNILPPLLSPELDPRTKHQQQNPRRGARKSRTGSERRRDAFLQLSSLDRGFVLRIAREIEDWGGRSSHHPLLIKGVTPSDQQLVLLIADYYEGLDSELDWAGVRISKTSPPLAGFETPPIPLSEVLLHSTRTRTSNYPPPTSKNSSSSPPTISSSSSKFSNHLPPTSPRRWSTNEPYPNNQYHDSSIFPNKSSMPSNWSSRRGSDSATAAVDPGGYESLTFGSVQRPGPPPPPSTSGRVDLGRREWEGEIETIYGVQERGEPFGGKHHDHVRSRQASASGTTYAPPWPEASFMAPVPVAVAVAVAGSASGPADTTFINPALFPSNHHSPRPPLLPPNDEAVVASNTDFSSSSNDASTSYGPPLGPPLPQQHHAFFYQPHSGYHHTGPPPSPDDPSSASSPSQWIPPPNHHPFYPPDSSSSSSSSSSAPIPYYLPSYGPSSSSLSTPYYGQPGGHPTRSDSGAGGVGVGGRGGWAGGRRGRGGRRGGVNGFGGYRGPKAFEERGGGGLAVDPEGGRGGAWSPGGVGAAAVGGVRRRGGGGVPLFAGAGSTRGGWRERPSTSSTAAPASTSFPSSSSYPALPAASAPSQPSSSSTPTPTPTIRTRPPGNTGSSSGETQHPLPARPTATPPRMNGVGLEEEMARLSVGEDEEELRGRKLSWAGIVREGGRSV